MEMTPEQFTQALDALGWKQSDFCRKAGFDYVSCSPYRVPLARLASAHLALLDRGDFSTMRYIPKV